MTKVKNLNGTDDNKVPSGYKSWKDWWETKKKRKFGTCSCGDCSSDAEVGAHVQKVGPFGDLRIVVYLRLPEAYRCLSRPSSSSNAKASTMRPY